MAADKIVTRPTIVPFTIPVPFNNIPGRLRRLADQIEAMADETRPATAVVVMRTPDGCVDARCYGDNPSAAEAVGILMFASRQFGDGA